MDLSIGFPQMIHISGGFPTYDRLLEGNSEITLAVWLT